MPQRFEFCRVCRQNHNQGRGHRYSPKHKQCLERLYGKMLERILEIRHYVKNVAATDVAEGPDHRHKFWCQFCEQDIIEKQPSVARTQAINHLASANHIENIKHFWAANGGDVEKQHLYFIDGTDLASWEEGCSKAEAAASVRVGGPPLSSRSDVIQPEEVFPSTTTPFSRGVLQRPVLRLSEIQVPTLQPGAAPPWLKNQNLRGDDALLIGAGGSLSSDQLPLSRTQKARLSKIRNPNRVGAAWAERRRAELERGQRGEVTSREEEEFFPNFGRVWQSGPRRDSRKEFEAEKHSELQEQKRGRSGPAKKNVTSRNFELKPYISRKQTHLAEPKNSR